METSAQVLDWIMQISQKTWCSEKDTADLIEAIRDLVDPQGKLCSFGRERGPRKFHPPWCRLKEPNDQNTDSLRAARPGCLRHPVAVGSALGDGREAVVITVTQTQITMANYWIGELQKVSVSGAFYHRAGGLIAKLAVAAEYWEPGEQVSKKSMRYYEEACVEARDLLGKSRGA